MLNKDKFRWKYNTNSRRLAGFDYSANWYYFVTICSKIRWDVSVKMLD
ncbi:MAG: hypothetical protein ACD_3C00067G0004 [uncultured bacterium (gcode 4)]|uniref:Uncharacterized protein n=1 Tax=uncultured bacterium (gcode 4) TaxID=1234023 RepID=K2GY16_9BACT|nr:MAG: hypothetical protein ACD_3C00067G0004 [uncultured bacterium (gcode 4)]